jgi:hypothetical protein
MKLRDLFIMQQMTGVVGSGSIIDKSDKGSVDFIDYDGSLLYSYPVEVF